MLPFSSGKFHYSCIPKKTVTCVHCVLAQVAGLQSVAFRQSSGTIQWPLFISVISDIIFIYFCPLFSLSSNSLIEEVLKSLEPPKSMREPLSIPRPPPLNPWQQFWIFWDITFSSHNRRAQIKKLISQKLIGAPKPQWWPLSKPRWPFLAPWWPFWIFEVLIEGMIKSKNLSWNSKMF